MLLKTDKVYIEVDLWGLGSARREFLYFDLAQAVLLALSTRPEDHLYNVGTQSDLTIRDLALLIQKRIGYQGKIRWDGSKPEGTPRKCLDCCKINSSGWSSETPLEGGISKFYRWRLENEANSVGVA